MSQPSVTTYFNSRKRSALEESKVSRAKKVLILDKNSLKTELKCLKELHNESISVISSSDKNIDSSPKIVTREIKIKTAEDLEEGLTKKTCLQSKPAKMPTKHRKLKELPKQSRIQEMFNKMAQMQQEEVTKVNPEDFETVKHVTPPSTPTKSTSIFQNKINSAGQPSLQEIRQKIVTSSKCSKLKQSLARFKEASSKLEEQEKKTAALKSPSLKTFQTINLEVNLSPQKVLSPEKAYLSPKKNSTSAKRNILGSLSPTKHSVAGLTAERKKSLETPAKESLTLPYKYRFLAEIFRALDTVSQLLFNRKETITFNKLKPAVEKILKRNFSEKHLAQIKTIYPEAFDFQKCKIRSFGAGLNSNNWELTVTPSINGDFMTSELILERRRKLFSILIEKLKDYHAEFLQTLDPPLEIPREVIKRWHPLFDLEKVPDIEPSPLPELPKEEKLTSGQEVLEKAKVLFSCNTRMERALQRLKEAQGDSPKPVATVTESNSILKGIPKALLEKVRQRQAAKALDTITRSETKEKELQMYTRLPEIARIIRNLFVAEKKNVLPFDTVLLGLDNSIHSFLNKKGLEEHVRLLAKEAPDWLTFLTLRGTVYIKIVKNADLAVVIKKLDELIKIKSEF
ncbi:DNA replication factor Cdt1 [Agrilus planipennis]|uniref:DNA replication factor Cdt1 n=1 Tax=Agrilus planipennis TaxID=224129 RepID=A0A1W4WZ13_AGRPL|nr:DNA replication factor Cdt1 [Agrilus planipennis]